MSTVEARPAPTLSALPATLKKRIVRFLQEIDEEEQQHADDGDDSCCGGGDHGDHDGHEHAQSGHGHGRELTQLENGLEGVSLNDASNVSNLSLTNKEWHAACCAVIWQSPDLAERSLESLVHFYQNLLPKYAEHVEALFMMQNSESIIDDDDAEGEDDVDEKRVNEVLDKVEKIANVSKPTDLEIRQTRARSLILAEIVRSSPKLAKVEFDSPELNVGDDDDEAPDLAGGELEDHVLAAVKAHAATHDTISHIGYSMNPISATTYDDLASLVSTYAATVRSLRLDCNSPRGDPDALFDALRSVERLESLDLADSDFAFDVDALFAKGGKVASWPLRRLVLGEFLELSPRDFARLVNRFSSTLTILGLDGCPYLDPDDEDDEDEDDDAKDEKDQPRAREFDAAGPIDLSHLETLEISTNDSVSVLEWITKSSTRLSRVQVGFCPNFDVEPFVEFVERRRDSLRDLEVDVATFSHEEVVKVGTVCEELKIAFVLVSSDFDDYLGGDFEEDDGDAEWEDEE